MPRVSTAAVKRKAIKLYGIGHTAASISKEVGVSAATIRGWAKAAGVKRSDHKETQKDEDKILLPMELDESLPIVKLVKQQEFRETERNVLGKTVSPAEQFQTLVAANGIRMLDAAFQSAPVVKNIRDLKTLTEIVSAALGLNNTKGGVGNRMSIDLNILTKGKEVVSVDAEIVKEKD